jgi:transcriptional regulator with XRE-family HTH domain
LGVTQAQLAFTAGLGLRFIAELEKGKPTCELGKTLQALATLGIDISLNPPVAAEEGQDGKKRVNRRVARAHVVAQKLPS